MKDVSTEISINLAHKLELEFLTHFEGLFWELKKIYNPLKERFINIKNKNSEQNATSEREKVKQLLIKHNKTDVKLEDCPFNRSMCFTIFEKKMLSQKTPWVKVIAAVRFNLEAIIQINTASEPLDSEVVAMTISDLTGNPDIFHYIGLFSPSGWSKSARYIPQEGANYKFLLIESPGNGFNIINPVDDSSLNKLFDPEDDNLKKQRALNYIKELQELQAANRIVLIADIAEACKISEKIVLQAAQHFALQDSVHKVEFISKSWVIYRVK